MPTITHPPAHRQALTAAKPRSGRHGAALAAAFLVLAATAFVGLGSYGLVETSDARYAEIAREMHDSGDWLVPRLYGLRHLHKPPLIYWAAAAGYTLLGVGEWGARICQGLFLVLLGMVTASFARRHLGKPEARWSLLFVATTPLLIGSGRLLTTDLLLTLLLTVALAAWYDLWSGRGGAASRLALAFASGGIFLAKGPVGWLVLGGVVLVVTRLHRPAPAADPDRWRVPWMVALALVVALPWYAYIVLTTPDALGYFLGRQLADRLGETGMGHPQPWHFFLWILPAGALPWVALAPAGWRAARGDFPPLGTFLAAGALVPLVLFSLPATKLPLYVLPATPFLALLAARGMTSPGRWRTVGMALGGAVLLAAGLLSTALAAGGLPSRFGDLGGFNPAALRRLLLPPGIALGAAGLAMILTARRRPFLGAALGALAVTGMVLWSFTPGRHLPLRSTRLVAVRAARELRPGDRIAAYHTFSAALPFYLGRWPILVDVWRDTRFEREPSPLRAIILDDLRRLWRAPARLLVITEPRHLRDLPKGIVLARGGGYVLVANRESRPPRPPRSQKAVPP